MLHVIRCYCLEDQLQRVQVAISRKKRHSTPYLCEDTPNRPRIYCTRVGCIAHEKFRRTVPPCRHIVSVLVGGRGVEWPSEAEIAQLNDTSLTYEEILGLDVPMDDTVLMQIVVSPQYLEDNRLDAFAFESVRASLEFLEKRPRHEIKYKMEFAQLPPVLDHANDVVVAMLLEDTYFSHHRFAHVSIFFLTLLELFNRHYPT